MNREILLKRIEIEAAENNLPIIGPEKGQFLADIIRENQPRRILEIGTSVGYSAMFMAEYLPIGGKITTFEISVPSLDMAEENIQLAGLSDKIEIIFGKAQKIIPNLSESFDMIFIDAEKKEYLEYLKAAEPKLLKNALVVADNVGNFQDKMNDFLEYIRNSEIYSSKKHNFDFDAIEVSRKLV